MAHYDVLIKGGMVVDGKRGKIRRGDIGVNGDKIKIIDEDLSSSGGDVVINAAGKYVAPGFIDITNHSDTRWSLFTTPRQDSMLHQGVTTILGGNCGASLAPLARGTDIEGIEKWMDVSQININWQGMNELLAELDRQSLGINFATLVGHGTLRKVVLGEAMRAASPAELDQMRLLLERSLKDGAFGISTSLGSAFGRSATSDEVTELFKIVADYGALSKHHLQDEGINILPALSELLEYIRKSGARCQISHIKALGRRAWKQVPQVISMINGARAEGLDIGCDVFPYTRTGSDLYTLLPGWSFEAGKESLLDSIRDAGKKASLKMSLQDATLHYEKIIIASTARDTLAVGKTIADLAFNAGSSPEDALLDLLDINDLKVTIFNEVIDQKNLEDFAAQEYASIASDGAGSGLADAVMRDLPHPRSFGAYPKVFNDLVKEKGLLTWEEAVYKMSGLPAGVMGLKDRGVLESGAYADIVVFDPEAIRDLATYANPRQFAEGVEWVLVNGKPALEKGKLNGVLSGRVLRR